MTPRPKLNRLKAALALAVILVLAPGLAPPARADMEDAAMFYEELAQQGEWVDYENYGPVWHPTRVDEGWRPYTNGRWTPTSQGYVFETHEPWGWATYHYGNWMPTPHYGWVWVPGRTWYPNTVAWRNSPETASVDTSYIGWAPIPPPNYVPPPGYYPPGGYSPGGAVVDLITAPFWIFAKAAQFLLGFGQPYVPSYSYYGCGCLSPPAYVPVLYPRTVFLTNYVVNPFYPRAFFAFGPPIPYVARVTRVQQVTINNYINTVNVTKIVNVTPPAAVINKNVAIRHITPAPLIQGRPLPRVQPAPDVRLAQAQIARPNVAPVPREVPRLARPIPKAAPPPARPHERMTGTGLPSGAAHQITPKMRQEIQKAPAPPAAKMGPGPREMKPGGPPAGPPAGPRAAKPRPAVPPSSPPAVKPGPPTAVSPAGPPAMKPGPQPGAERQVRPAMPPTRPKGPEGFNGRPPEGFKGRQMSPNGQPRGPVMQPGPRPERRPPAEFQKQRPQPQPQMRPQQPMRPQKPPKAAPQQQKQQSRPQNQKQQQKQQQPQ